MGKIAEENVYRRLGEKINNLTFRAPWNDTFYNILKNLYTEEEAALVVNMPYGLSSLDRISKITKIEENRLRNILEKLCNKGLLMDPWNENDRQYYFMPSPLLVGIFEFTMKRKEDDLKMKEWAKLFHDYMSKDDFLFSANFSHDEQISPLRVIPVEETIKTKDNIAFLDYEKVSSLVENSDRFAIHICSCRKETSLNGEKECDVPLESCTALGFGADYLIRNNLGREITKSEMLDHVALSKELGLVFCADNVKNNPSFICHCCKCCCLALAGLSKYGYTNSIITSNFISKIDESLCKGCGKCLEVCPVNAMSLISANDPKNKKKKKSHVNTEICVGCGVCASKCPTEAVNMINRGSRVIHPETTFERIILQSLDRGTIQNQLFDNPQSVTQKFMRSFVGGFLRLPPVKKALLSDLLRSSFLGFVKTGAKMQGKGWMTEL